MDQLQNGTWAEIDKIAPEMRAAVEKMGLKEGASVRMCGYAPFGRPVWIFAGGNYLALSRMQARRIFVRELPGGEDNLQRNMV